MIARCFSKPPAGWKNAGDAAPAPPPQGPTDNVHQTGNGIAHDCGNVKSRRVAPGRNEQSCYTMDAMLIDLEDSDVKEGLSGVFPS